MTSGDYFFEGVEKLLEIWFGDSKGGDGSLLDIPRCEWEKLVGMVNAKIISSIENEQQIHYLLSESSLLISKHRVIIKTCGTTKCLQSLQLMMELALKYAQLDTVADIFYSRRNFTEPEQQHKLHATFENEVEHLDRLIDTGAPYCLGRMNRDCWYLYTTVNKINCIETGDQTFEVLMSNLDQNAMKAFYAKNSPTGAIATKNSGIGDIVEFEKIDAFQFEPCGYSANAIIEGDYYWNIHITPEKDFSYASFETNYPQENYDQLMKKIIDIFKPGKMNVTIMANKNSVTKMETMNDGLLQSHLKLKDLQTAVFPAYKLHYSSYCTIGTDEKMRRPSVIL